MGWRKNPPVGGTLFCVEISTPRCHWCRSQLRCSLQLPWLIVQHRRTTSERSERGIRRAQSHTICCHCQEMLTNCCHHRGARDILSILLWCWVISTLPVKGEESLDNFNQKNERPTDSAANVLVPWHNGWHPERSMQSWVISERHPVEAHSRPLPGHPWWQALTTASASNRLGWDAANHYLDNRITRSEQWTADEQAELE